MSIKLSSKQKKFQKKTGRKYWFGTGRRKRAVAQVRMMKGRGDIIINAQSPENYFYDLEFAPAALIAPLKLVGYEKKFDFSVIVKSGGRRAQVEAIRLGIARALLQYDQELKKTLKRSGFLTRDPREKERKKPGLKRARRAPQWSKR